MPWYEYDCICGWKGERKFSMSEVPAVIRCPYCDENANRAFHTAPGLVFKGGGWCRSESYEKGAKKDE